MGPIPLWANEFSTLIDLDWITGLFLKSDMETGSPEMHGHWMGLWVVIPQNKIQVLFPGNKCVSTLEILFSSIFLKWGNWWSGQISQFSKSHSQIVTEGRLEQRTSDSEFCPFYSSIHDHDSMWLVWPPGRVKRVVHRGRPPKSCSCPEPNAWP